MSWWRHNCAIQHSSVYFMRTDNDDNIRWNMSSFGDKILTKNLLESKIFSARKLTKEFPNKNWKRRRLDDFCESCAQPVKSNAVTARLSRTVADAVAVEDAVMWSRKFHNSPVEYSFVFPSVHKVHYYNSVGDDTLRPGAASWRTRQILRFVSDSGPFALLCENVSPSLKPEVHNVHVLHCQRSSELRSQVTQTENSVKFVLWFLRHASRQTNRDTDRQTNRHADRSNSHPYHTRVIIWNKVARFYDSQCILAGSGMNKELQYKPQACTVAAHSVRPPIILHYWGYNRHLPTHSVAR